MTRSKIQDQGEVLRWFEEGRTYEWMKAEYLRKYDPEVSRSTFAMFGQRMGLDRRIARDKTLIPWTVEREHRHTHDVIMLRYEARRREGRPITPSAARDLEAWLRGLSARNQVIDYCPVQGFRKMARRPGLDLDLVRVPDRVIKRGGPATQMSSALAGGPRRRRPGNAAAMR